MSSDTRVLVTGGSGFIGGRVVEALHLSGFRKPVAGLRRWASAARVARFPVDMVRCDVLDPDQLREAMDGVGAIVHCAVGDHRVTVEGTRNVMAAALDHGVDRIVHLSTVEVYGPVEGEIDESSPIQRSGNPYADSKVEAEQVCTEFIARGGPIVILRAPIVYGPFSELWTIRVADRLGARAYGLAPEERDGTCNLLYVDDLVLAVLLALDRPDGIGQAFNVNGPERLSWNEYLERFNRALGLPPLEPRSVGKTRLRARLMSFVRAGAKFLLGRFQPQIQRLYTSSHLAKRLMKSSEQSLRLTPTPAELKLYRRRAFYVAERARTQLGYQPRYPLDRGLATSLEWLNHHRLPTRVHG